MQNSARKLSVSNHPLWSPHRSAVCPDQFFFSIWRLADFFQQFLHSLKRPFSPSVAWRYLSLWLSAGIWTSDTSGLVSALVLPSPTAPLCSSSTHPTSSSPKGVVGSYSNGIFSDLAGTSSFSRSSEHLFPSPIILYSLLQYRHLFMCMSHVLCYSVCLSSLRTGIQSFLAHCSHSEYLLDELVVAQCQALF